MRYAWTLGALLALNGASSEQEQAVLRITVSISDTTDRTTAVPGYALLVSDNPPTREPRRIRTAADGTATLTLRPGSYTVESDRPLAVDGKGFQWTEIIEIAPGRDNILTLTSKNAQIVPLVEASSDAATTTLRTDAAALIGKWQGSVVGVWSPTTRASGFVVDSRGLIATNRQAIGAAATVEVQVSPTLKVPARVLVAEPTRDVAILWIDPSVVTASPPVLMACPPTPTSAIDDGDEIVAIATRHLGPTELESGEVTALQPRAVATDLRLSFGGVGGPVFNESGTLIGLSSLAENDATRTSDVHVVRSVFICEALTSSLPKLAGAAPPEPTRLPVDPVRAFPANALTATAKGVPATATPIAFSSSDFDVVLLTPPIVHSARERAGWTGSRSARTAETEARLGQLTEFGAWSDYFSDLPPVLIVRVTPKLVEGFWKRLGREAARTQGAVLPPFKDFKTSFGRMRLTCGASDVTPLHPFVLEHRVSEKNMIREGLYVFAPDALGPHCDSVTLALSADSASARTESLTINRSLIDRIWEDFASYRAMSK